MKNTQLAEALKKLKKPESVAPKKSEKVKEPKTVVKTAVEPVPEVIQKPILAAEIPSVQETFAEFSEQPKKESFSALEKKPKDLSSVQESPKETKHLSPSPTAPKSDHKPATPRLLPGFVPPSKYSTPPSSPKQPYQPSGKFPASFRPPGQHEPRPMQGFRAPGQGFGQGPRPSYPQGPRSFQSPRFGAGPSGRMLPPLPPKEGARSLEDSKRHAPRGEEEASLKKAPAFKEFKDIKAQKKIEANRFDSRDKQGLREDADDEVWRRKRRFSLKSRTIQEETIVRPKSLKVRIPITVKDLAAEMKLKSSQLISSLFMKGITLTLNDFLDDETTIQLLGHDFECEISIDTSEETRLKITDKTIKQEVQETPAESLVLRPPVVTFMGHVDHGKTSLIDAIRKSNVVQGEAGAITQHIGAFKCHTAVGDLTILDTPGHEAFSAMRSRGADVTDLVVLVIAGDEGMRAQTIEAMNQAKEAKVPILVALNKCDKPNFSPDLVYRQLSEQELLPEIWGGQTITVNCSALTGEGIKELLEMLALQAEILELKANPATRSRGTVIESEMHKGLGAIATVLVQNGTLHLGDAVVFDQHFGKIKTMHNEYDQSLDEATPSTPVKITGLSGLPEAGSDFIVVKDEKEARELSEDRLKKRKHVALQVKKAGAEQFLQKEATKQDKKVLNLVLRADVQGSLEALKHSLAKIESTKIDLIITSAEVGEISESDIELASASKSTIVGFHTKIESRADAIIKELKVKVRLHDIIYHAVDDVKEIMVSLLDKVAQENDAGEALVKATFKSSQLGNIAGCQISEGTIRRNSHVRLVRDKQVIWKGPIASLKRVKEDVREVTKGLECGILLQGFSDFKEGDILQAFDITYLTQEL